METLDSITLNFNEKNIFFLNLSLAFIMFGVALNLTPRDFRLIFYQPKSVLAGLISQFLILPAVTFVLVWFTDPHPSIAMGMMMVAACPGGNISNFMSSLARGNVALSVSLSAIASILAIILTPFNFAFYAGLYPPTAHLLREINMDYWGVFETVIVIMGIPIILGMLFRYRFPRIAIRLHPIMHWGSILIFAAIILIAFYANFDLFLSKIYLVIFIVFLHNAFALISGYQVGSFFGLSLQDKKTLAIETGIQNSGLGLILIFAFFDGLGGMALVAAWWGIWHILSGLTLSYWWHYRIATVKI